MKVWWLCIVSAIAAAVSGNFNGGQGTENAAQPAKAAPVDVLIGPLPIRPGSDTHAALSHPHPHGHQVCASGCAVSRHPTKRLTDERFSELISKLADRPNDQSAIDELLYFGPQARARFPVDSSSVVALPPSLHSVLMEELRLNRASVAIRLVTASGELLADLPDQLVPLDIRHEFDLREHNIPPLLASGTVKRVGRYKLWSRL